MRHGPQRLSPRAAAGALVALAVALTGPLAAGPARAQAAGDGAEDGPLRTITVPKDKSAAFHLDYPASEIVVSQPDMLQLVATTDRSFYVRGKALGVTNLLIYDRPHHLAQVIDVRVGHDTDSLQADLARALPGEHIVASNLAGGILLSGSASTATVASRAKAIAERYAPQAVSSSMVIASDQQVMVEVRVIEANRSSLRDVGFNFTAANSQGSFGFSSGTANGLQSGDTPMGVLSATGKFGDVTVNANLAALEQKGLVRTLAKPDLIAMSGEEASFLAGGEFPYPVPNGLNNVTVEFRQYGVKLNVTPVVQDNGDIRLKVSPEVSQLDSAHSVTVDNFSLPALTVSRASTVVELRDGQSFAIAGLFQRAYNNAVDQIPGLSDLPVLGSLFRSSNWQHQQTELVIIVTPHLVAPSDHIESLPNPLTATQEPSAIDLILMGMTEKPAGPGPKTGNP
ncbi:MAG: type II and III secretion system protein family protein [Caulobacteraceae bacterium]|nr:type II and III secretion system protein family protein [Caulobacteraceae bacterium]